MCRYIVGLYESAGGFVLFTMCFHLLYIYMYICMIRHGIGFKLTIYRDGLDWR